MMSSTERDDFFIFGIFVIIGFLLLNVSEIVGQNKTYCEYVTLTECDYLVFKHKCSCGSLGLIDPTSYRVVDTLRKDVMDTAVVESTFRTSNTIIGNEEYKYLNKTIVLHT